MNWLPPIFHWAPILQAQWYTKGIPKWHLAAQFSKSCGQNFHQSQPDNHQPGEAPGEVRLIICPPPHPNTPFVQTWAQRAKILPVLKFAGFKILQVGGHTTWGSPPEVTPIKWPQFTKETTPFGASALRDNHWVFQMWVFFLNFWGSRSFWYFKVTHFWQEN